MGAEPRKPFLLRIDPRLWRDLETWAQEDLRSVNGQIEFLLRQAVIRRKGRQPELAPAPATEPPLPQQPGTTPEAAGGGSSKPPVPDGPAHGP